MSRLLHPLEKIASLLTKYIGLIIICFSVLAFFWRDGFAWTTTYTSVFLGVAMFGMGLTLKPEDFKVVRPDFAIITPAEYAPVAQLDRVTDSDISGFSS